LESQLTVYRDDSEVSQINRTAHPGPVNMEPRLFALLALAAEISRNSGGAYDVATGALTKLWGFFRRQGRMPDDTELASAMQRSGMRHVELDHERQTVRFLVPGVEINLGSIGKGYAVDRMAELLVEKGISDVLLHGGNSSVLGRGGSKESGVRGRGSDSMKAASADAQTLSQGERETGGWWIGIMHPMESERRIGQVCLRDRALGTSGSGTQFFVHKGRRYGHILDPRTGRPAEGTLSVTVTAPTAAEADALATAFYVLGVEGTRKYCRGRDEISAVMMSPAAIAEKVEIAVWGWREDDIQIYQDESLFIRRLDD
jgi:FAD:protein FMN transferase